MEQKRVHNKKGFFVAAVFVTKYHVGMIRLMTGVIRDLSQTCWWTWRSSDTWLKSLELLQCFAFNIQTLYVKHPQKPEISTYIRGFHTLSRSGGIGRFSVRRSIECMRSDAQVNKKSLYNVSNSANQCFFSSFVCCSLLCVSLSSSPFGRKSILLL